MTQHDPKNRFCVVLRTVLRGSAIRGQAILPMLIVFVLLVGLLGVALGSAAVLQTVQSGQQAFSEQALAAADAGVRDAILKLTRDRSYPPSAGGYEVKFPGYCATVEVLPVGSPGIPPEKTITAEGRSRNLTRHLEATVLVPENGNVIVREWKEVSASSALPACTPGA